MPARKLPKEFDAVIYIEGFLHDLASAAAAPDYGYSSNHVPETTGRSRKISSSFDIAKQRNSVD